MDRNNVAGARRLNRAMPAIAALVLIAIIGISYRQWRRYNRANGAGRGRFQPGRPPGYFEDALCR
jgi:hypothetical protein